MDKTNYEVLAKFYHDSEDAFERGHEAKPKVDKPWPTFTEDVKDIEKELLVSHYTPDVLPKQSKKKLRKRGKIQYNKKGEPIYLKGDTVRGSLHKDTFYGAIKRTETNKKGELEEQIKYVVRKPLDTLEDNNIKNIVDDRVREIVENARKEEKKLKKEIEGIKKILQKAEEHEEENLKQEIAILEEQITLLYSLPNKNGAPVPIKKVRLYQTPKGVLQIKTHRDIKNSHKESYLAETDDNYIIGIYEYIQKGSLRRKFKSYNNFTASAYLNSEIKRSISPQGIGTKQAMLPKRYVDEKGIELRLRASLKIGTLVILYLPDETPENFISWDDLPNRLYKVYGFRGDDGRIKLRFHNEARPDKEQEKPSSSFTSDKIHAKLIISLGNFNALIEGVDFELTPLGKIKRLK